MGNKKKFLENKFISEEDYRKLLKAASRNFPHYLLFLVAGNLGLRVGELVRLRVVDLKKDEKGYYLKIPTLKRGFDRKTIKGSIKRGQLPDTYEEIPVSDQLGKIIEKYIKEYKLKNWFFPWKSSHLPEYTAARIFKRYAKKIGLSSGYSIHCLRHFKGFQMYKATMDLKAVQIMLRHKSIKTTSIYAGADLETKRKISEKINIII